MGDWTGGRRLGGLLQVLYSSKQEDLLPAAPGKEASPAPQYAPTALDGTDPPFLWAGNYWTTD